MQVRKLVKSGMSSYTIALPKEWLEKNKLKKGDVVYVEEKPNNTVAISTEFKEKTLPREDNLIMVEGKEWESIKREIRAAYLMSYGKITLKGKDLSKNIKKIKEEVYLLPAAEIVDESSDKLTVRNFLDLKDIDVKLLFRRVDNIVRSMMMDLCLVLEGKSENPEVLIARDKDVNRITFLNYKILKAAFADPEIAKKLDLSNDKFEILSYWELNMHLEKIGDEVKRIAKLYAPEKEHEHYKCLHELIKKVEEHYVTTMTSFYKKDRQLADRCSAARPEMIVLADQCFKKHHTTLMSEVTGKVKGILSHLNDITRLVRYL